MHTLLFRNLCFCRIIKCGCKVKENLKDKSLHMIYRLNCMLILEQQKRERNRLSRGDLKRIEKPTRKIYCKVGAKKENVLSLRVVGLREKKWEIREDS